MNKVFNRLNYEEKLKLISCYQSSGEIFDAWNTLSQLPEDLNGKKFLGEFKEDEGKISGFFTFERVSAKNKRKKKGKSPKSFMKINIYSDKTLYISAITNDTIRSAITQSADHVIEHMLDWAACSDSNFDFRLDDYKQRKLGIKPAEDNAEKQIPQRIYTPMPFRGPYMFY
jgi:hypothetical protein